LIVRWPGKIAHGTSDQPMISMDFLPTLLAAASGAPDPSSPPDGENLLPVLMGQASAHPRKLYWRFRSSDQAAVRDGNWKYLQLAGNEFLFDVAKDQRERANLKNKFPNILARLKADYAVWNATMLPYQGSPRPPRKGILADRY
jgi:arylsulfatase A-like enzyme